MELNPVLKEIYETGKVRDVDGDELDALVTSITREEGEAIYDTIVRNEARRTMEIGVAYGVSTLFICQALRDLGGDAHHIGLDPFEDEPEFRGIGRLNVERAGYGDLFTMSVNYSQDVLPNYLINGDKFDFIFIDGHHTFEQIMLDFYYSEKIIEVGGHIMFHDVLYPSVRKALAFIVRNLNFELAMDEYLIEPSLLGKAYTLGRMALKNPLEPFTWRPLYKNWTQRNFCIIRRVSEDTRNFDHYVPF